MGVESAEVLGLAGNQIIDGGHMMSLREQALGQVGADKPGSPGDQCLRVRFLVACPERASGSLDTGDSRTRTQGNLARVHAGSGSSPPV